MAEKGAELVVRWLADTTGLEHGAAKAEAATEKTSSKFSALGVAAKAGAVGGVLILAEGLNKSVEAAQKDQIATARLEAAFRGAHVALRPYKDSIDAAEKAGAKLGFTGEQVKDSIGSLVVATHDGKTAVSDLAAAEDIARFKHIDLAAATRMLVMAQTGSQRATKQLGLEVQATTVHQDKAKFAYKAADDAIKAQYKSMGTLTQAQKDQEDALRNNLALKYNADKVDAKIQDHQITGALVTEMVTKKLHGQADAYAQTAAGAKDRLGAALDQLEVKVGSKILPILTKLTVWLADNLPQAMAKLSQFWAAHGDQIIAVANKIGSVVVPMLRMVKDTLQLVADLLQGHWSKAWDDARRVVIDNIDAIKARVMLQVQLVETLFGGLAAKVAVGLGALGKVIQDAFNGALAFVKGLPQRFYREALSIGKDLVRGILDGLTGLGSSLYHKATGELGAGLSKIKGWARISSPSGLWRDEIGRPFAAGVVDGFIAGMSGFEQTVTGLINLGIAAGQGALDSGFTSMISSIGIFAQNLLNAVDAAVAAAALEAARRLGQGLGNINLGGNFPGLADGGIVEKTGLAVVHEGEQYSGVGRSFGGGGDVHVHLDGAYVFGTDLRKAGEQLAEPVRRALLRQQRRNGNPVFG